MTDKELLAQRKLGLLKPLRDQAEEFLRLREQNERPPRQFGALASSLNGKNAAQAAAETSSPALNCSADVTWTKAPYLYHIILPSYRQKNRERGHKHPPGFYTRPVRRQRCIPQRKPADRPQSDRV